MKTIKYNRTQISIPAEYFEDSKFVFLPKQYIQAMHELSNPVEEDISLIGISAE